MNESLSFVDSSGLPERVRVLEYGVDEQPRSAAGFRTRTLRLEDGRLYLQRRLLPAYTTRAESVDALEAEIRAGLTLVRMFLEVSYPAEFTRLAGYAIEVEQPFLLLDPPREGRTLAERAGGLMLSAEQKKFESSLFRALRLLEWAGLVHRSISPATVRWDGARVQLTNFGSADRVGRPRQRMGSLPWAPPEQREGTGANDHRDDIWSAGQLVYFVAHAGEASGNRMPPVAGPVRDDLLKDVFAERAEQRPDARTMLRRIAAPDPWDDLGRPSDPLLEGRHRFTELLADKGTSAWPVVPRAADPRLPQAEPDAEPGGRSGSYEQFGGGWGRRRGRPGPGRWGTGGRRAGEGG
ncbi:hypothetical protein STRCI_006506 [Streptomyces cinnabarinus]|uniref:Protein kinase domain-containing protein n=1 Tax=Streptomyces cinnabarinus TaxID=67287 RepID=A0ABY7KM00_9ACTN|nr:hypothetical protein [Streptomyces cinnabarinus]WAZ25043.1 hypothetical protein STRCI_006506 [Streptomyces cinnabarinus]